MVPVEKCCRQEQAVTIHTVCPVVKSLEDHLIALVQIREFGNVSRLSI